MKSFSLYLCSLSLLVVGLSNAQELSPINPKHNFYSGPEPISFEWNDMVGASSYEIQIAQSIDFSGLISSGPISVTNYTFNSLGFGVWYWRIIGNAGGNSDTSNVVRLNIYDPSQTINTRLWMNAAEGVTLDASNKVQQWADQSPFNILMTQIQSNQRPSFNNNAINGHPALEFGGSHFLEHSDILDLGTSNWTFLWLGRHGTSSGQTYFGKTKFGAANGRYAAVLEGGQVKVIYTDFSGAIPALANPGTNFSFYEFEVNKSQNYNRLKVNSLTDTKTIIGSYNHDTQFRFLIGAYNNFDDDGETWHLQGAIPEMVFLDTRDSATVARVKAYLLDKYSPRINLGEDITITDDFCAVNLNAPLGYSNLLWSTGETTQTISVDLEGLYWVEGKDVYGRVSRDTIFVDYPDIQPQDTNICEGSPRVWNVGLGPTFSYDWSTNETTEFIEITTPGVYNVTVTGGGCSLFSGDYTFVVDDYPSTASLGIDTNLCVGNDIFLKVGANETVSYLWANVATGPTFEVDTTGNYFVEATNINGCIAYDTVLVTINGVAPDALFSNSSACEGVAMDFTDMSTATNPETVVAWEWDFGTGVSMNQNPSFTFPGSGLYDVELYVESSGGCGATITQTVEVYENPVADFQFSTPCDRDSILFTSIAEEGSGLITIHNWDFGQPSSGAENISSEENPKKQYGEKGIFVVNYDLEDEFGCVASIVRSIDVRGNPTAQFDVTSACLNKPIEISESSTSSPPSLISGYFWDFGDGTTSNQQNPVKSYALFNNFPIVLEVTADNGCKGYDTNTVEVAPNPVASIDFGPICVSSISTFTDGSSIPNGSIDSSFWTFNGTDSLSGFQVDYVFETGGQQQIVLETVSDKGCRDIKIQQIQVDLVLDAQFTAPINQIAAGDPLDFTNMSVGQSLNVWDFGDGSTSVEVNPSYAYDTTYIDSTVDVTLYVYNVIGCVDSLTKSFEIREPAFDLELSEVFLDLQGQDYLVGVKLGNNGTVPIEKVDLEVYLSNDGIVFSEQWTGQLLSLESEIYIFNARLRNNSALQSEGEGFVCVKGYPVDELSDTEIDLFNNNACKRIEGSGDIYISAYPNPAEDEVHLDFILDQANQLEIELLNQVGQELGVKLPKASYETGFHSVSMDVSSLSPGIYILRIVHLRGTQIQRVIVK